MLSCCSDFRDYIPFSPRYFWYVLVTNSFSSLFFFLYQFNQFIRKRVSKVRNKNYKYFSMFSNWVKLTDEYPNRYWSPLHIEFFFLCWFSVHRINLFLDPKIPIPFAKILKDERKMCVYTVHQTGSVPFSFWLFFYEIEEKKWQLSIVLVAIFVYIPLSIWNSCICTYIMSLFWCDSQFAAVKIYKRIKKEVANDTVCAITTEKTTTMTTTPTLPIFMLSVVRLLNTIRTIRTQRSCTVQLFYMKAIYLLIVQYYVLLSLGPTVATPPIFFLQLNCVVFSILHLCLCRSLFDVSLLYICIWFFFRLCRCCCCSWLRHTI